MTGRRGKGGEGGEEEEARNIVLGGGGAEPTDAYVEDAQTNAPVLGEVVLLLLVGVVMLVEERIGRGGETEVRRG